MLDITIFDGARRVEPHVVQFAWSNLCDLFEEASVQSWTRAAKLDRIAYVPGHVDGRRAAENVRHLSFGSYDIDLEECDRRYVSFAEMRKRLDAAGLAYILATSTKSLTAAHRYRLILRFDRTILPEQHSASWNHVNEQFGDIFDPSTHDCSRLSFFPARWEGHPVDTSGRAMLDWPVDNAFQAFACSREGAPFPFPEFSTTSVCWNTSVRAPRTRAHVAVPEPKNISQSAQNLLNECAAIVPPKNSLGYALATNPKNAFYVGSEPFGHVQGGRMFRFLCRVAARALRRRLPLNADLLFDLATAVNEVEGGPPRPDLRREVHRALARQAELVTGAHQSH
ncbi:hypothetical protein [Pseudopontixanthobacter vadosimaris]|uniref:hypothetical protein n=1 Tax=Pseudopontixanthobacter vadosimaris TaxID=2726450 RepID=UPI00147305A6|nr:hypothetical protein [Pseudopontixanthobacter vadosimaris]